MKVSRINMEVLYLPTDITAFDAAIGSNDSIELTNDLIKNVALPCVVVLISEHHVVGSHLYDTV